MKTLLYPKGGFSMRACAMLGMFSILALHAGVLACSSATALADNVIRGSAQNLSRGQPAAGDEVILICINLPGGDREKVLYDHILDPETQEEIEARGRTDAQGAFTFAVQHPDKPYLVRVVHQGVSYDQQASAGDSLSIQVFDAAQRLSAIAGSIEILRVGTRTAGNEKFLHVSDMYEIRNDSRPPMTQAGTRTFDVYLPAEAKIDSVLAAAPSAFERANSGVGRGQSQGRVQKRIGVMISATPVPGRPGHYAVDFPLRPGATKFAFNYDLPYEGRAQFHTRHKYGFQQMAVMIPPAMKFSSPSSAFQKLATGNNEYQVEAAIQLKAGNGPGFEISESGPLPPLQNKARVPPQSSGFANSTASAPALPVPPTYSAPKLENASRSWAWLALMASLLLACAFLVSRIGKARPVVSRLVASSLVASRAPGTRSDSETNGAAGFSEGLGFMQSLKEELFQLETDRIRGSISKEEYASARQALEETFKRVVSRRPVEASGRGG
jgi:hypothetical protein